MRKKILLDILPGTWLWLGHYNVSNQGSGYDSRMRRCTDEVVKTVFFSEVPEAVEPEDRHAGHVAKQHDTLD